MQETHVKDKVPDPNSKSDDYDIKDSLGDVVNHVSDFVNTFYRLQILNLTKKATDVTANLAGKLVSAVLGVFIIFFASTALAFWLGDLVNSRALGFLLVAVLFALIAVIFMSVRKKLVFPMWRNKIIRKLYE